MFESALAPAREAGRGLEDEVVYFSPVKRRGVVPRSVRQKEYVEAMFGELK